MNIIETSIEFFCLSLRPIAAFWVPERGLMPRIGLFILGISDRKFCPRMKYLFGFMMYQFEPPTEHYPATDNYSKYLLDISFLYMEFEFRLCNYSNNKFTVWYRRAQKEDDDMPF